MRRLSRRSLLAWLGSGAAGLAFSGKARAQVVPQAAMPLPSFTGPGANPYWNGVNPLQPPLTSATWEAEVNKMIGTFGAPIPEPSARAIIAYLKRHYTPETRKE